MPLGRLTPAHLSGVGYGGQISDPDPIGEPENAAPVDRGAVVLGTCRLYIMLRGRVS